MRRPDNYDRRVADAFACGQIDQGKNPVLASSRQSNYSRTEEIAAYGNGYEGTPYIPVNDVYGYQ